MRISCMSAMLLSALLLGGCGPKNKLAAQTEADTPANNYDQGLHALEQGDLSSARASFDRALGLDKDFAPAHRGLALVDLGEGSLKSAESRVRKALTLDSKDPSSHVAYGRILSARGDAKGAHKRFERALKLDKDHIEAHYYEGQAYESEGLYQDAMASYKTCQEMDRKYTKALKALENLQTLERASAGLPAEYKRIAMSKAITRADLAALLINEVKLERHIKKGKTRTDKLKFSAPGQGKQGKAGRPGFTDLDDSWARGFIKRATALGVMEGYPDGTFRPLDKVNRGELAMILTRVLVAGLGDEGLETQFVGQSSPYTDIGDSSPVLNAVMVVSSRSILKAKLDGSFGVTDNVTGRDGLDAVKKLEGLLEGN